MKNITTFQQFAELYGPKVKESHPQLTDEQLNELLDEMYEEMQEDYHKTERKNDVT